MTDEERRLYLQSTLETLHPGLPVYYRPPGNMILSRPCVVYEPKEYQPAYANSEVYIFGISYQVTILSSLPGYAGSRNLLNTRTAGISVRNHQSFVHEDIVNDVFQVSVNSITL